MLAMDGPHLYEDLGEPKSKITLGIPISFDHYQNRTGIKFINKPLVTGITYVHKNKLFDEINVLSHLFYLLDITRGREYHGLITIQICWENARSSQKNRKKRLVLLELKVFLRNIKISKIIFVYHYHQYYLHFIILMREISINIFVP